MSERFREAATEDRTRDPDAALQRRRTMRMLGALVFLVVFAGLLFFSQAGGGPKGKERESRGGGSPPCPQVEAPDPTPPMYEQPPGLELPDGADHSAIIRTSCGDIELDLLEQDAPKTVANFIFLSEEGFFDGLPWLRIERDFIIQTGDPDGIIHSERDGPGYTIPDELPRSGRAYLYGTVAMANEGVGKAGSQFFIVVHDPLEKKEPAGIEPEYSIFGQVSEASYETLDKIATMPVKGGDDISSAIQPRFPVVIESIEIVSS